MNYTSQEMAIAIANGTLWWDVRKEGAFIARFSSPRQALFFANRNDATLIPDIIHIPKQMELNL